MPLDGHAHLVAQGWSGKGTGLRNGAITKPITVLQKKTLAGIGKDRDDAFPFWDHVFQAAAVSIQVKIHNSDDESDSEGSSTPGAILQRTKTGIISNRRPVTGTPALSGTATPSEFQESKSMAPRLSVMAAAKQQAARRMLYSMFYRGPVLSTEDVEKAVPDAVSAVGPSSSPTASLGGHKTGLGFKRKSEEVDEDKEARKRRKREAKGEKTGRREEKARAKSKGKGKEKEKERGDGSAEDDEDTDGGEVADAKAARKTEKAERKRLKAEKRARKEERRKRKAERKARQESTAHSESDPEGGPGEPAEGSSTQDTVVTEERPEVVEKTRKKSKRTRDASCDITSKDRKSKKNKS